MKSVEEINPQPLSYYLALDYPITFYPEEVGGFTVMLKDLPGCMSQGETLEEAYEMIAEAKELWLETCYEDGFPIPLPHTMAAYSGKTMLRMPKYLHQRLAESAKREGVSLNQYLVALLSERNAIKTLEDKQASIENKTDQPEQQKAMAYSAAEGPTAYSES
ncbi:MAG: type II toxin-antitoxin system HicB family antitoxin [Cyanobacteria bacterium J06560_6]